MRIVTWNMCGGTNVMYLNTVIQKTSADFLCLQECGEFTKNMSDKKPIFGNNGAIIGSLGTFKAGHDSWNCVYWENNSWTQGGMVVMTTRNIINPGVLLPVVIPGFVPGNPRGLPYCTVQNDNGANITIYSVHAPPVFKNVTTANVCCWNNAQLNAIAALGGSWACIGDFNTDPTQAGYILPPVGTIIRGTKATQQGGGIIDYTITNVPAPPYIYKDQSELCGSSDHYPQVFHW
jgi:endonuclease/exonuclease/phosphatase family metal-dependent hydrolase